MIEKQKVWVRIAGNASKVKSGDPHGWRCYFKGLPGEQVSEEISLTHWQLEGAATIQNVIPGFDAKGDEHHIVAWIDVYGDANIDGTVLSVSLRDA